MAALRVATVASDPNSSVPTVESQKAAMMTSASAPAAGWTILSMAFDRFPWVPYATQMPGTATFWKRCGEALAEAG